MHRCICVTLRSYRYDPEPPWDHESPVNFPPNWRVLSVPIISHVFLIPALFFQLLWESTGTIEVTAVLLQEAQRSYLCEIWFLLHNLKLIFPDTGTNMWNRIKIISEYKIPNHYTTLWIIHDNLWHDLYVHCFSF